VRHFKTLGVAFAGLLVLGATATSAFATLPVLSAATFPLHLDFADNGTTPTTLENSAGTKLTGKGLLLLLLASSQGSLGLYLTLFLNVALGATKCNTPGDASGEVLLANGEYHLVFPSLSPLLLGIAILVAEFEIKCGLVPIKVRGCVLAKVTDPKTETEEVELATGELNGSATKGKNELTEFDNEAGTGKVSCRLESNASGGAFGFAAEIVGEPIHLLSLGLDKFKIAPI
jgi:hypothetical protein